jgi:hypothetical protein
MGLLYELLFWFTTLGTFSSGLGFLFKRWSYTPQVYMVNGQPGTGTTDFEVIATFVFALVYLAPIAGLIHAQIQGAASAKRSALIAPMLYHFGSVIGAIFIFGQYLNPAMTSPQSAALVHGVMGALFLTMYATAENTRSSDKKADGK